MAPYHVMLVHFPIALWTTAALIILLRFLTDSKLARAADSALTLLLFLGAAIGLLAAGAGLLVWPTEAATSSPLARNHMLFAVCSLAFWIVVGVTRWRGGEAAWQGLWRWIMLGLAAIGIGLLTVTATLGGHLAGNPSAVSGILRRLGWEVYTTYYLPNWVLIAFVISAVAMTALGFIDKRSRALW